MESWGTALGGLISKSTSDSWEDCLGRGGRKTPKQTAQFSFAFVFHYDMTNDSLFEGSFYCTAESYRTICLCWESVKTLRDCFLKGLENSQGTEAVLKPTQFGWALSIWKTPFWEAPHLTDPSRKPFKGIMVGGNDLLDIRTWITEVDLI